jgi:hypothetical protein
LTFDKDEQRGHLMTTRVTTKTVVFSRPFVLNEADGEQQPGIYTVETEEEPLDVITVAAYRRLSTVMNRYDLHGPGGLTRFVTIDPAELDVALARDAIPPWHEAPGSTLFN